MHMDGGERSGAMRLRRRRWLALAAVLLTGAAYLAAIGSTHVALSGGFVGWSDPVSGHSLGLGPMTAADQAFTGGQTAGYSSVLWADRPGGEVSFGFSLHNGGLVPVTVLGLRLRGFDPGVINDLVAGGAQLGPGKSGGMTPFHPVTIDAGDSLAAGLTERVACDPNLRRAARQPGGRGGSSWLGDATSPVVVHYRALGVSTAQTLTLATPVLVVMPYRACA
jgi:hypothetical protein